MARARSFAAGQPGRVPAASNPNPSDISNMSRGTFGGMVKSATSKPGRPQIMLGDEMYLWILVLLEVGATAYLRKHFRRYHGG